VNMLFVPASVLFVPLLLVAILQFTCPATTAGKYLCAYNVVSFARKITLMNHTIYPLNVENSKNDSRALDEATQELAIASRRFTQNDNVIFGKR